MYTLYDDEFVCALQASEQREYTFASFKEKRKSNVKGRHKRKVLMPEQILRQKPQSVQRLLTES